MEVAWVPELPMPGALGITRAPGSDPQRSLDQDLAALCDQGVGQVLCLLEDEEFSHLPGNESPVSYANAVAQAGLTLHRSPIEDYTAPGLGQLTEILCLLDAALNRGERVVVHCMAGLGRAGTVAACLLVARGVKPDDAILLIRWIRPGAIQSDDQEALIRSTSRRS